MSTPEIVAAVVVAFWLLTLLAQLGDSASSWLDVRSIRAGRAPSSTRRLVWLVPVVAALSIPLGIGLAVAGRVAIVQPAGGALLALGVLGLAVLAAIALVSIALRVAPPTTSTMLAELRTLRGHRLEAPAISSLRVRLAAVAVPEASGGQGLRIRLLPIAVGVGASAACIIAASLAGASTTADAWRLAVASVLLPIVSGLLALMSVRGAETAGAARVALEVTERGDALRLLDELDRASRKGIAGLSDRVTRALQILRDQQAER